MRVNRVVDHIDAHLAEPLDLAALATPPQAALTIALDVDFGSPSAAQRSARIIKPSLRRSVTMPSHGNDAMTTTENTA